jgi:8-oxo-dGTP pyrophosphatase MutT (NUDIX family)
MVQRMSHAFPVSVKGVAVQAGRVLLLENERAEWELPGGKLELGEDPAACVVREIGEESGWEVAAGPVLDCWQYHIRAGSDVLIVTYGCHVLSTESPVVSHEHNRAGLLLSRRPVARLYAPPRTALESYLLPATTSTWARERLNPYRARNLSWPRESYSATAWHTW